MLDSVTKKRIDDLRDILVGKIPSPQSQVEQITTGLIYKFMYDMDVEAVEMGGVPSFFVDDYKKYSWKNLFDPKLGGADKVQLYSDAIENMYVNPTAPQLFRDIFKNSFLPFKDPYTLNMFLKGINEFHYSHSEKLGDAYEYLLSFMGSQGDAGQFRTPRHIIDFIVEIVNPQKDETILDPACGTAGFLISSFKHILSQNTNKKVGDKLNASERRKIGDNLVGYDIAPEMTRLSLVNMYLHQFASPKIYEYDTLSSDDRWNEYYDVIIANPPFFSPKGGIQPHSRFGVDSSRAEVLFVDYILEHLKPNGRAGIVVPEGITSRPDKAYQKLRAKIVQQGLVGIVSLPPGVFQPYSPVKTSVLIIDQQFHRKTDCIFFADVKNDGFTLGKQRTPIKFNDLPKIKNEIFNYLGGKETSLDIVSRSKILDSAKINLTKRHFVDGETYSYSQNIRLEEVAIINAGNSAPQDDLLFENGTVPFIRTSDVGKIKFGRISTSADKLIPPAADKLKLFKKGSILFPKSGASTLLNHRVILDIDACVASHLAVITPNENCLGAYLLYTLSYIDAASLVDDPSYPSLTLQEIKDIEIPLPPIEIQKQIVSELDSYQRIIEGCQQVIDNYRPAIDINPAWDLIELGEMATTEYGTSNKSEKQGEYGVLRMGNLQGGEVDFSDLVFTDNKKDFEKLRLVEGDVLFNRTNSPELVGKTAIFRGHEDPMLFAGYIVRVQVDKSKLLPEFLNGILNSSYGQELNDKNVSVSGNQANINATKLRGYLIPTPHIDIQKKIVAEIEEQRRLVENNKKLILIYSQKMQNRIKKIWEE